MFLNESTLQVVDAPPQPLPLTWLAGLHEIPGGQATPTFVNGAGARVIHVLRGHGEVQVEVEHVVTQLDDGSTVWIPAGALYSLRNTGALPLLLYVAAPSTLDFREANDENAKNLHRQSPSRREFA